MNHSSTSPILIFGQAVDDLPQDLFIPAEALHILLQHFEGPLDLLLYLIRKQNIDILDIPMERITDQYLDYIEQMNKNQIDLAAEYLLMTAILLEIKSRLLLPEIATMDENEEDPRTKLVQKLLLYEKMKYAAEQLNLQSQAGRDFFWATLPQEVIIQNTAPSINIIDLQQAWLQILQRAKQFQHHKITEESLTVSQQMNHILETLQSAPNEILFTQLFNVENSSAHIVVTFIALLELIKESLVFIYQDEAFSQINIKLNRVHSQQIE